MAYDAIPDNKVHGANMGPIWGRQDPGGPHVGPMNFAIWGCLDDASGVWARSSLARSITCLPNIILYAVANVWINIGNILKGRHVYKQFSNDCISCVDFFDKNETFFKVC